MSVVIHEVAHGYAALRFGDKTALYAGRLTLNPLKHLDMFGSIILPALLVITNAGFILGWAKPVPYNPNNLTDKKKGTLWVSVAGILANLALAVVFGIIIRIGVLTGVESSAFYFFSTGVVMINIVLGVFNLIPIPPLDGSKILFELLPASAYKVRRALEKGSIFIVLIFVMFFWQYLTPVISFLFKILTGMSL